MGVTSVKGPVVGPAGERSGLDFLVDSAAFYTLVLYDDWLAIGLTPRRTQEFSLADGSVIERQISECSIRIPQGEGTVPVVLGAPGYEALLCVSTLEYFGLMLNPFRRTLEPMRLMLT